MRVHLVLDGLCPEVQYRIYHRGCLIGWADLAFLERRLAVEYDGVWHGAPLQVGQVFVTAQHLGAPRGLVYTVRAALQGRRPRVST
ncbi:MAG TPA: hypothetical protein VF734_03900 [Pseudonocardiaceae bacterium]|jgi:hypothetical protein